MEEIKKKFPKGALSFYIELYCKRKSGTGTKGSVQKEALKSWLSLSKSEKKLIQTKYKGYQNNFKKNMAMCLRNAEPYLKSKVMIPYIRNRSENVNCNNEEIDKEILQNELISSKIEDDNGDCAHHIPSKEILQNELLTTKIEVNYNNEECADHSPSTQNEEHTNLEVHDSYHSISNNGSAIIPTSQNEVIPIPEPIAPKIMTGKELFLMIKEREENNLIWEEFTKQQKRRYTEAVLAIKKNYLKQYKEYLEHLPSEKLFKHYRNIVSSEK